jgi:hypothetical protein
LAPVMVIMLSHDPDSAHLRDQVELTQNGLHLFEKAAQLFFCERIVGDGDTGNVLASKRRLPVTGSRSGF